MLSRTTPAPSSVPYADPVAMELLAENGTGADGLGVMNAPGLGVVPAVIVTAAKAAPYVVSIVRNIVGGGSQPLVDPIRDIWSELPPAAINAREGADGWWYDLSDGHRLSHDEAAKKQQQATAATIGATVGSDGWWYGADGHRISHDEAWQLYSQLASGGSPSAATPMPGSGGSNTGIVPFQPAPQTYVPWGPGTPAPSPGATPSYPPTFPQPSHPAITPSVPMAGTPLLGGVSPTMLIGVGAAVLVVAMLAGRKRT